MSEQATNQGERMKTLHEAICRFLRRLNQSYTLGEISFTLLRIARDWSRAARGEL